MSAIFTLESVLVSTDFCVALLDCEELELPGKINDTTNFTITLYLNNGEDHNFLGQTTEDPSQIDKDIGISLLSDHISRD